MKGVLTLFKKFQRSIAHFAYDNPTTRFLFIKAIIERTLAKEKLDANGIYLDIGCDKGYASIVLYETFSEIINLDLNKRAIESCKENCESRGINAHFVVADASVLPFKNSCINVITAFSLIEHLRNQHDFVCEVSRIVGDKGVFIMQFPNRNFFLELHTGMPFPALIPRRIWKLYCRHFLKITHELHIQNLTSNEATRICRPLFSHIRIEKCNYTEEKSLQILG